MMRDRLAEQANQMTAELSRVRAMLEKPHAL